VYAPGGVRPIQPVVVVGSDARPPLLIYPGDHFRSMLPKNGTVAKKYFPTNGFVCEMLKTSNLLTKNPP
jgi:hypothetical protein